MANADAEARCAELERKLAEAEELLAALGVAKIDGLVVEGPRGVQIYSVHSPEEPYRVFVERMQQGAVTLDDDGQILFCNARFAGLVRTPREQLVGASFERFVANASRLSFRALLESGVSAPARAACELVASDGGAFPVHLALSPLNGTEHRTFGLVVTDLSEEERARRLDAARRSAEAANLAKDQFLAVVSHELRTPLNAVLGWAQVLAGDATLNDEARHGIEVILRNARAQAQLINDLLDISRIIAGRLRLELRHVDLADVADAVLASITPAAQAKGIQLVRRIARGAGVVSGDPDRLQQVIWNLLSNAVKFTPHGGRVELEVARLDGQVRITVRDDGQGFAPDFAPKLFSLFQQADTGTTRRTGGLGVGLAIVKQLAELHGGSVSAWSDGPGKGCTITVLLPVAAITSPPALKDESEAEPTVDLRGVRVLLVEDNPDACDLLRRVIERAGAEVIAVASAAEALARLDGSPPDVIVSDIGLPGVDGYELIRRVRALDAPARHTPAIALTAFARAEDRRRALLSGYQMHVAKPVDGGELWAAIASLRSRNPV
jgi:PAS domain S-box-containing protein